MGRFSVSLTGTYPTQILQITDTVAVQDVLLTTGSSRLHTQLFGSPTLSLATCSITAEHFERVIPTPDGDVTEEGADLTYTLTNLTGSPVQVGSFQIQNLKLGATANILHQWIDCVFRTLGTEASPEAQNYPGTLYFPGTIIQATDYNVAIYVCYDPVLRDHPVKVFSLRDSTTTPANQVSVRLKMGDNLDNNKATLNSGESRQYRVCIRIQPRTSAASQFSGIDLEWLWTLASYRDHFRSLYGKPDYRSMGGWDGRPIRAIYMAPDGAYVAPNPRRWNNAGTDPTITTGYAKIGTIGAASPSLNIDRCMIWALSGWHIPGAQSNYPFRFATGVLELNATATGTVEEGLATIRRAGVQQGLWWGLAGYPDLSAVWDVAPFTGTTIDFNDKTTLALAFLETDLAINKWGTEMIGLDAYADLPLPRTAYLWLQNLKSAYLGTLFITEQSVPDYLHVLAPTFIIESPVATMANPFWLHHYINPGSETLIQITDFETSPASGTPATSFLQRVDQLAALGYTVIGGFTLPITAGVVAADRWTELGETAIQLYDEPLTTTARPTRLDRMNRMTR